MKWRSVPPCLIIAIIFVIGVVRAQDQDVNLKSNPQALIRLLHAKGILSDAEAASVSKIDSAADAERRIAQLLQEKGLISQKEYAAFTPQAGTASAPPGPAGTSPAPAPPSPPQEKQAVIPAVAPIRSLPLAGDAALKRDALIPAIRIGADVKLKPYGMIKANFISDSSSPGGNDFPLPGFLGDAGPGNSPEMHFNARSSRLGTDIEWLDRSLNVSITGKFEADFEGNFSRANNRNISSVRSPALQMRLAYVRIDRKFSDKTSAFALFGQDWTSFGSSTLPPILETTGLGLGYGILYERAPQFRFGIGRSLGGVRQWRLEPEVAFVLPAFGNTPSDISNQLAFGERQGADSNTPEIQGRFVTQFQLDRAPGVVPAQLIVSGTYGKREAIILAANVPAAFKSAFPTGATAGSSRYGLSAEAQLPTRFFTLLLKGFNGEDLRFYFSGDLFSNFNDTFGLSGTATAPSIDGSSTVVFGLNGSGVPTVAPQRPVRAVGGFVDLAFPLSRILHANPDGRNAGWTLSMLYTLDNALARDVRRIAAANRSRDDILAGTLTYKFNKYFSVIYEESYYRTRAADKGGPLPIFRGVPAYQWHDVRQQLSVLANF